jgi:hypothetical protein
MVDCIVADVPFCGLPSLVYKRDGRLVPFEADKISQSLYAATEELGRPSAFLARELTDGVLHFLAADAEVNPPATSQIADLVAKVVRELGQPALAQMYADRQHGKQQEAPALVPHPRSAATFQFSTEEAPAAVVRQCLRSYSLQAVFARDLAAAHEEGLVSICGLENPEEFARQVVEPPNPDNWLALLDVPARTIVFDSPELALTESTARSWLLGLATFCECSGRSALLNLHVATPPAWADPGAKGPLFDAGTGVADAHTTAISNLLLDEIQRLNNRSVRVDWHLSETDFRPGNLDRLEDLARRAVENQWLGFALDRPRRPVALAAGLDRRGAAVLQDVGLDLPHFLGLAGVDHDGRLFLEKLPSLARMAVRTGIQKRNYLRSRGGERPLLARGFLLERARLVVNPMGLNQAVETLLGQGIMASKLSLDLGQRLIQVLRDTFQKESVATNLDIVIDGPHAAGASHGIGDLATIPFSGATPKELLVFLSHAWRKTDAVRLSKEKRSE